MAKEFSFNEDEKSLTLTITSDKDIEMTVSRSKITGDVPKLVKKMKYFKRLLRGRGTKSIAGIYLFSSSDENKYNSFSEPELEDNNIGNQSDACFKKLESNFEYIEAITSIMNFMPNYSQMDKLREWGVKKVLIIGENDVVKSLDISKS